MLLYPTAKAEYPTLCPSVKVRDLAPYFATLVEQISQEDCGPSSLCSLDHPIYQGRVRIAIGGDKGGKVMKWSVEIASNDAHIFGMFEADDNHANLEKYLVTGSNWEDQFRCEIIPTNII